MLTDTLVLLLCTAATAGENGKFPWFNPIYAPGKVVAVQDLILYMPPETGKVVAVQDLILYMPLDRW